VNFGQEKPILSSSSPSSGGRIGLLVVLSALILTSLACQINLGGPARPGAGPIQASSQQAQALQDEWAGAIASAGSQGDIVLKIDEAQLTSFLALSLEKQADLGVQNPQVYLRHGEIQLYATLTRGVLRASILLGIAPRVDSDGRLAFEVTSADFGPVPMPDVIKSSVSSAITEAFAGSLGPLVTGIDIQSIEISDGEMALSGRFR
jgi:hypothetical protein